MNANEDQPGRSTADPFADIMPGPETEGLAPDVAALMWGLAVGESWDAHDAAQCETEAGQ